MSKETFERLRIVDTCAEVLTEGLRNMKHVYDKSIPVNQLIAESPTVNCNPDSNAPLLQ
jgi:hypothetical protein